MGEALEISTLDGQNSKVGDQDLSSIVGKLSYLVKLIETTDNLSVQVHPNDEYANRVEQSLGKSECWLVLDAKDGAGIYLGFKPGVTKEAFETAVIKSEAVDRLLNFYPVKRGDFFFVPAGSIHAIGANVLLAEVQQSCGVTYRVWDWNRTGLDGKPRELHLKKALDVIEFDENKNQLSYFDFQERVFDKSSGVLAKHKDFKFQIHLEKENLTLIADNVNGIINLSKEPVKLFIESDEVELEYLESAAALSVSTDLRVEGKNITLGHIH